MIMEKEFNVTGTCIPEIHYMVDTSTKLDKVVKLIEKRRYFIINRPRQYGKTTTFFLLDKKLNNSQEYISIKISFEGIGDAVFENEEKFVEAFLDIVIYDLNFRYEELGEFLENEKSKAVTLKDLSRVITKFIIKSNKKVVLMIDEVDKSSNNQLFLSFLGMLRNKYLLRNEGRDYTFHSVILAGVHDVKSMKLKIRPDEEQKYNSPWNIATDFDVDMSFSKEEIETMLIDYIDSKGVKLNKEYFSQKLHFYTSGYPFLVSKLCKIIDEKIMNEEELQWKKEFMDLSVKELLKETNTNFDGLIKNIENNKELFEMVKNILIEGLKMDFNIHNPEINLGALYGIFRNDNGKVKIHNRVYEQLIYNYMVSKMQTSMYGTKFNNYNERSKFVNEDGTLDIKKVLVKFQEFMKHEYSENRRTFLEEDGRLIFLAFISPIINGVGFAFKEVKGGEEKRFDIVITYEKKMYIIELKIWRGEEYHKKGLIQLGEYLEQYELKEGYLLIFDFRKSGLLEKVGDSKVKIDNEEKNIVEVYC